jgi:hypothetical protein
MKTMDEDNNCEVLYNKKLKMKIATTPEVTSKLSQSLRTMAGRT